MSAMLLQKKKKEWKTKEKSRKDVWLRTVETASRLTSDAVTMTPGTGSHQPRWRQTPRLYLMRRSLEVLRKFYWMILGGRFNQLSHVSSPLLSKPGEYYFSFGRHLDELHVAWAHLEKKQTRLRANTKTLEDLCSQSLETARGKQKEIVSLKDVVFTKGENSPSGTSHEVTSDTKSVNDNHKPLPHLPKLSRVEPIGTSKDVIPFDDLIHPSNHLTKEHHEQVVVKKTLNQLRAQKSQATSFRKALKIPKSFIPCKVPAQIGAIAFNNGIALLEHKNPLYHPMLIFMLLQTQSPSLSCLTKPLSFDLSDFSTISWLKYSENYEALPPKETVRASLATLGNILLSDLVAKIVNGKKGREFATQSKAPTNKCSKKKKIPSSSKPKTSSYVRCSKPKKPLAETQHAKEPMATVDTTKSLDACELAEEVAKQPSTTAIKNFAPGGDIFRNMKTKPLKLVVEDQWTMMAGSPSWELQPLEDITTNISVAPATKVPFVSASTPAPVYKEFNALNKLEYSRVAMLEKALMDPSTPHAGATLEGENNAQPDTKTSDDQSDPTSA
ncbi:hypothetical protein Tco_0424108 [Tanacetum coccineum]